MTNVENEIANISASETVIAPLLSTGVSQPPLSTKLLQSNFSTKVPIFEYFNNRSKGLKSMSDL